VSSSERARYLVKFAQSGRNFPSLWGSVGSHQPELWLARCSPFRSLFVILSEFASEHRVLWDPFGGVRSLRCRTGSFPSVSVEWSASPMASGRGATNPSPSVPSMPGFPHCPHLMSILSAAARSNKTAKPSPSTATAELLLSNWKFLQEYLQLLRLDLLDATKVRWLGPPTCLSIALRNTNTCFSLSPLDTSSTMPIMQRH